MGETTYRPIELGAAGRSGARGCRRCAQGGDVADADAGEDDRLRTRTPARVPADRAAPAGTRLSGRTAVETQTVGRHRYPLDGLIHRGPARDRPSHADFPAYRGRLP